MLINTFPDKAKFNNLDMNSVVKFFFCGNPKYYIGHFSIISSKSSQVN